MQLARVPAAACVAKRSAARPPTCIGVGPNSLSFLRRDTRVNGLLVTEHIRRSISPTRPLTPAPAPQPDSAAEAGDMTVAEDTAKQLLLAKAWNFLSGASGAFIFPYLSMFLAQRGLSSAQIGLLAALRPWLAAPASMATSALADKYKSHTKLLLLAAVGSCMLRSSLPLADSAAMLFVLLLVAEIAGAPVGVLGDSTVLSNCRDSGDYGKQRQWASIGWGLASLPAGWLISQAGLTAGFLVYGLASIPLVFVASQMRYKYKGSSSPVPSSTAAAAAAVPISDGKQQQQQRKSSSDIAEAPTAQPPAGSTTAAATAAAAAAAPAVKDLLLQPAVMGFLWKCLLMGFGLGVMSTYEFLFLKTLGAPETLMGMALVMSVCTEVPAFAMQGSISKLMPAPMLLNLVLAVTALRLACYAGLPLVGNTWAVLPVELLHGITFGVGFSTATVYSGKLAPPELAATFQGMWQATYAGIGAGVGGLVGGVLMERYGGQGLFMAAAAFVAAGAVGGVVMDHFATALQARRKPKAE